MLFVLESILYFWGRWWWQWRWSLLLCLDANYPITSITTSELPAFQERGGYGKVLIHDFLHPWDDQQQYLLWKKSALGEKVVQSISCWRRRKKYQVYIIPGVHMLLHHGTPTHTVRVYQTLHMYVSMHTVHPSLLTTWNLPVSTLGSCNSQKEISSAIQILSLTHSLSRVSLGNWSKHKSLPCSLCCSCKEEPYNKSSACCYFCCCITERFYTNTSTHTWHESPNRGWSDMSPNSTAPGACPETARDSKREKRRRKKKKDFKDRWISWCNMGKPHLYFHLSLSPSELNLLHKKKLQKEE